MTSRQPFAAGELEQLVDHVAYEAVMVAHCRAQYAAIKDAGVLELLLLHGRNLREFLFSSVSEHGRYADNALIASDYAPLWMPNKGDHRYQVIFAMEQAMDAQVAHLSRQRANKKKQRDLTNSAVQIADALGTAWGAFRQELTGTSWESLLDAAITSAKTRLGIP